MCDDTEPFYITRPCQTCGITIRVTSMQHNMCGAACAELARRRKEAERLPYTDQRRHCVTPQQKAMQNKAMRKRGLK